MEMGGARILSLKRLTVKEAEAQLAEFPDYKHRSLHCGMLGPSSFSDRSGEGTTIDLQLSTLLGSVLYKLRQETNQK
jgi:hypothetical protein